MESIFLLMLWILFLYGMYKAAIYFAPLVRIVHWRFQKFLKNQEEKFFNEDNYR